MEPSDQVASLLPGRRGAEVWLVLANSEEVDGFDGLARAVGLSELGPGWVEVDRERAREFLAALLHKDLAYGMEMMPLPRAEELADEFLRSFDPTDARFATNSAGLPGEPGFSWIPLTVHTFDAGVAVIGTTGAGICWVADED